MATLYDKAGKGYNIPHAVDVKEWLATGKFFKENPKEKQPTKPKQETEITITEA